MFSHLLWLSNVYTRFGTISLTDDDYKKIIEILRVEVYFTDLLLEKFSLFRENRIHLSKELKEAPLSGEPV